MAFLDVEAARVAVPEVNQLLAKELGWGSESGEELRMRTPCWTFMLGGRRNLNDATFSFGPADGSCGLPGSSSSAAFAPRVSDLVLADP